MLKLSFILLFLTTPIFNSSIISGVPLWVYGSLGATLLYALVLIFIIEKKWSNLQESHE